MWRLDFWQLELAKVLHTLLTQGIQLYLVSRFFGDREHWVGRSMEKTQEVLHLKKLQGFHNSENIPCFFGKCGRSQPFFYLFLQTTQENSFSRTTSRRCEKKTCRVGKRSVPFFWCRLRSPNKEAGEEKRKQQREKRKVRPSPNSVEDWVVHLGLLVLIDIYRSLKFP